MKSRTSHRLTASASEISSRGPAAAASAGSDSAGAQANAPASVTVIATAVPVADYERHRAAAHAMEAAQAAAAATSATLARKRAAAQAALTADQRRMRREFAVAAMRATPVSRGGRGGGRGLEASVSIEAIDQAMAKLTRPPPTVAGRERAGGKHHATVGAHGANESGVDHEHAAGSAEEDELERLRAMLSTSVDLDGWVPAEEDNYAKRYWRASALARNLPDEAPRRTEASRPRSAAAAATTAATAAATTAAGGSGVGGAAAQHAARARWNTTPHRNIPYDLRGLNPHSYSSEPWSKQLRQAWQRTPGASIEPQRAAPPAGAPSLALPDATARPRLHPTCSFSTAARLVLARATNSSVRSLFTNGRACVRCAFAQAVARQMASDTPQRGSCGPTTAHTYRWP